MGGAYELQVYELQVYELWCDGVVRWCGDCGGCDGGCCGVAVLQLVLMSCAYISLAKTLLGRTALIYVDELHMSCAYEFCLRVVENLYCYASSYASKAPYTFAITITITNTPPLHITGFLHNDIMVHNDTMVHWHSSIVFYIYISKLITKNAKAA